MKVNHFVVCEAFEYDLYVARVQNEYAKIIILDQKFLDEYDTFDDLDADQILEKYNHE